MQCQSSLHHDLESEISLSASHPSSIYDCWRWDDKLGWLIWHMSCPDGGVKFQLWCPGLMRTNGYACSPGLDVILWQFPDPLSFHPECMQHTPNGYLVPLDWCGWHISSEIVLVLLWVWQMEAILVIYGRPARSLQLLPNYDCGSRMSQTQWQLQQMCSESTIEWVAG